MFIFVLPTGAVPVAVSRLASGWAGSVCVLVLISVLVRRDRVQRKRWRVCSSGRMWEEVRGAAGSDAGVGDEEGGEGGEDDDNSSAAAMAAMTSMGSLTCKRRTFTVGTERRKEGQEARKKRDQA